MHQNILKTRPGQLFKGHSMEASYNNNRDIVIRQSYYDVSIVDKLSTKDEPFTKAIYNQCITPKYVSKAIEVMYQKLHNKSIEFQIKLYNGGTNIDASFHIADYYSQITLQYSLSSDSDVNFGNHYENIQLAKKARYAVSQFKKLFKNNDIIDYLTQQIDIQKVGEVQNSLFEKDKFKINLVYLADKFNLNINDFMVMQSLNQQEFR